MREYISPNWHAVLIHAPLGLLSVGIVLELFGFLWRRTGLRPAARWMILMGAVTSVPALTSGIYAYRDVINSDTRGDITFQDTWADLVDGNVKDRTGEEKIVDVPVKEWLGTRPGRLLRDHMIYNATGAGLIFLVVVVWIGCADSWRRRLYLPLLLLLLAGEATLVNGSHNAGQAVYVHAVAVEPLTPPSTMVLTREQKLMQKLPPAQLHFAMAGWMISIALVALALSIRAIAHPDLTAAEEAWFETNDRNEEDAARAAGARARIETGTAHSGFDPVADDPATLPLTEPRRTAVVTMAPGSIAVISSPALAVRLPTSRFWILATALGLVAIASGLWIIGFWGWSSKWDDLRRMLSGENRNLYHSIVGTAIVVFTLVLAIVTRVARRNKMVLSIFSALLFLSIAAQVWLGILLTFDGPKGPLTKYNVETHKKSEAMVMPATESPGSVVT